MCSSTRTAPDSCFVNMVNKLGGDAGGIAQTYIFSCGVGDLLSGCEGRDEWFACSFFWV